MAGRVIHADDTPVPVLAPGAGKTKTGRQWVYLRDGRPHGGTAPPACSQPVKLASSAWACSPLRSGV
jgi:transposase